MAGIVFTDNQQAAVRLTPKTKKGNPAVLDGVPAWESLDPTVVTVTAAEDGMSAILKATGKLGNTQVKVVADADRSEVVREVFVLINVQVIAGDAATMDVEASTPEEQPE